MSSWLYTPITDSITLLDLLMFTALLAISLILARVTNALIRKYLDETVGRRSSKGVARILQYVIIGTAIIAGTSAFLHMDLTALFLSLGVVSVAVAFATQQIIQNAIAGVLISINKPIQVEDWVEVGQSPTTGVCRVKDIRLMSTELREISGRISIIPNSQIINGKLINYSRSGFTSLILPLCVEQAADIEHIRRIVEDEADRDPSILPKISEVEKEHLPHLFDQSAIRSRLGLEHDLDKLKPVVNVADIQGSRIMLEIKVWIKEAHRRDEIRSAFLETLRKRFIQENIELRDP
ncbi:MAG: mechanosensitive ion channel [Euryarchaeota archaeon]|nr:mechanosensitive ion channel [Euryarchaeota archaeon]